MATTTTPGNTVASKLVLCMEDIGQLSKDGRVSGGNVSYRYLSEEKITGALQDALVKHKLTVRPICIQQVNTEPEIKRTTKQGTGEIIETPVNRVRLLNTYEWRDAENGDTLTVQSIGEGMDAGDKATNKAMTAAYKYMVRHTLAISTGDDGDAQASSSEQAGGYAATPPQQAYTPAPPPPAPVAAPAAWSLPANIAASAAKMAVNKGFSGLPEASARLIAKDWDAVTADKALFDQFADALKAYTVPA
jgi:hypothetical protein